MISVYDFSMDMPFSKELGGKILYPFSSFLLPCPSYIKRNDYSDILQNFSSLLDLIFILPYLKFAVSACTL